MQLSYLFPLPDELLVHSFVLWVKSMVRKTQLFDLCRICQQNLLARQRPTGQVKGLFDQAPEVTLSERSQANCWPQNSKCFYSQYLHDQRIPKETLNNCSTTQPLPQHLITVFVCLWDGETLQHAENCVNTRVFASCRPNTVNTCKYGVFCSESLRKTWKQHLFDSMFWHYTLTNE